MECTLVETPLEDAPPYFHYRIHGEPKVLVQIEFSLTTNTFE
jgi:hypothetical protein